MIQGPTAATIAMTSSGTVQYSKEALQVVGAGTGPSGYTALLGWRETSRPWRRHDR